MGHDPPVPPPKGTPMRLRPALLALASALTLTFSVSTSAHAQTETGISYSYHDNDRNHNGNLQEQPTDECIPIRELNGDEEFYAYAPRNIAKNSYADIYEEYGCKGTKTTLAPNDYRGDDLHFQSVMFRTMG